MLMISKKKILTFVLICLFYPTFILLAQDAPRAYVIYNKNGEEVNYEEMIRALVDKDIILFGEQHNCPIAHWLELKVCEEVYKQRPDLIIGAEMFESDNQQVLNEYLTDLISDHRFLKEARVWPNYETDYAPLISFAKKNRLPVLASNVPRRYADALNKKGMEVLKLLAERGAQKYMVPLENFEVEKTDQSMFAMMAMMHGGGKSQQEKADRLQAAQSLKDATMAWNIKAAMKPNHLLFHINGRYHSDSNRGIVYFLKKFAPRYDIGTISTVRQRDLGHLEDENRGIADFIVVVPEDMNSTY